MITGTISSAVVLLAGISLCAFAIWGFVAPGKAMEWIKGTMDADWGIWFAVGIRVVLGFALIFSAAESRFPQTFEIIGWIAIVAAVAGVLLGRQRLQRFTNWWIERFSAWSIRLWVLIALAFGVFLVYGAW